MYFLYIIKSSRHWNDGSPGIAGNETLNSSSSSHSARRLTRRGKVECETAVPRTPDGENTIPAAPISRTSG